MTSLHDIDLRDRSKFRLIGESVLSYRFAVPYDAMIFIGEIMKITDPVKNLIFYAKITDLLQEANFADPRWDTRPYADHFYHLGDDVYLIAEAVPLGFVGSDGYFRRPRTIPTKFSSVERPQAKDLSFLVQVMGEIEVGVMKSGQDVLREVRVALPARVMPQHMGVFATTGMGKSNFMKVFCASCMKEQKFGVLIVDPHGEYTLGVPSSTGHPSRGLLHYQEGRAGLTVFTTGPEEYRKKYSLNRLTLEYDDFRASDLLLLFDHSPAQHELIEVLEHYDGSELIDFFSTTDFENFSDVPYTGPHPDIARRIRTFSPSTLTVTKRRIGILVKSNSFLRHQGSSIPEILKRLEENRVVLIDIPGMGERSELFVLSVITRNIMQKQRGEAASGAQEDRREGHLSLIVIEEAQRVLGAGGRSTQVFRECAMEGRKFGVGLCVITQQPRNVDSRVLAQLNTFVIMGLADRGDREIIGSSAKQDLSRMDTEIQTLEPGEAILSTIGIPFPVSTRIHFFDDYIRELTGAQKKSLNEKFNGGFT
ncbi:MAG: ATP-binding protein [Methanomicrobiales archaeon]|nr:ATP-binding protein [Methanomicrobiales archaeon]